MNSSAALIPILSSPAKYERARRAYRGLLEAAGRRYEPRKALDLSFPNTPRDGGIPNQLGPNDLMAWLIMDDRLALDQAIATGLWLWQNVSGWDRAHRQRIPWFPATYLAGVDAGITEDKIGFLNQAFDADIARTLGEKYLYSFVGSTTRPLVRTLGAAVMLAEVGLQVSAFPKRELYEMRDKALNQFEKWAHSDWVDGARWGWLTREDGFWNDSSPEWKKFPYLGGGDPIDAAQEDTWFHYAVVVPYEALIMEMYSELPSFSQYGVRNLASHAILYGYDPSTGLSLKSIGWKKGGDHNAGCMAPGFHEGPWREESLAMKNEYMEMSHFDLAPAIFACSHNREERKRAVVEWAKRCRSIGREGEVSLGTLAVAIRLGFGD